MSIHQKTDKRDNPNKIYVRNRRESLPEAIYRTRKGIVVSRPKMTVSKTASRRDLLRIHAGTAPDRIKGLYVTESMREAVAVWPKKTRWQLQQDAQKKAKKKHEKYTHGFEVKRPSKRRAVVVADRNYMKAGGHVAFWKRLPNRIR